MNIINTTSVGRSDVRIMTSIIQSAKMFRSIVKQKKNLTCSILREFPNPSRVNIIKVKETPHLVMSKIEIGLLMKYARLGERAGTG